MEQAGIVISRGQLTAVLLANAILWAAAIILVGAPTMLGGPAVIALISIGSLFGVRRKSS
jgi:hypothetical protein